MVIFGPNEKNFEFSDKSENLKIFEYLNVNLSSDKVFLREQLKEFESAKYKKKIRA